MHTPKAGRLLSLVCGALVAGTSMAALKPLNDEELSAVSGQALISLDALTYGGFQYTRINFGAEIDVLLNMDELRLGEFDRTGVPGLASNQPADILINNFALGRVRNSNTSSASIEPFKIQDPYLEFAFKVNDQGVREVAGVRLGFGKSMGYLSGDILSLTGNMQGKIYGPASLGKDYYMEQNGLSNLGCLVDINCIALSLAGDTEVYATVELLQQGTGYKTLDGVPINRATHIGVPAGDSLQTDATGLIAALIPTLTKSSNCEALGLITCFPLTNYKSIHVGDPTKATIDQARPGHLLLDPEPECSLAGSGQYRPVRGDPARRLRQLRQVGLRCQCRVPLHAHSLRCAARHVARAHMHGCAGGGLLT